MMNIILERADDLAAWRAAARALLLADVPPDAVQWSVAGDNADLFAAAADSLPPPIHSASALRIDRELLRLIQTALLHRDPARFALAYQMVDRCRAVPGLWRNPADSDAARLAALAKSVRRDIHKMHAFVRFRKVGEHDGREQFAAWFEPDHHITRAVAPFFRNRFTGMDWLIVTPEAAIRWDGKTLSEGPGGGRTAVPDADAVEAEWRAYYRHIFNPARLKVAAMQAEMPKKYWRNLPEADLIPDLIAGAAARSAVMVANAAAAPAPSFATPPADELPRYADLAAFNAALAEADAAPRPGFAAKLVYGEGPPDAPLLLVGEQPGDQEEQAGRPFIGPAGQLLNAALAEAGIDRGAAYLTNAVKRFKYLQRGPRRLHQRPNGGDIAHYRWWLHEEVRIVAPRLVVALGATAAEALTGGKVAISRVRGTLADWRPGCPLLITIHPSYLLRLPDAGGARIERERFIRDLMLAGETVG